MYSLGFRLAALRLLDFFGSLRRTAAALNVSASSISRWSHRLEPLQRVRRKTTLAETIRDIVKSAIDTTTSVTCTELVQRVKQVLDLNVSRSLVLNVIHSIGYSYKRVKKRAQPKDVLQHQEGCRQHERFYIRARANDDRLLVSIDESGFDHRALPFYGFAPRGMPAIVHYATCSDRMRHNLLMAVASDGSRSHHVHTGAVNGTRFAAFISSLPFPRDTILLLDNATIHKSPVVRQAFAAKGFVAHFLPPYSPQYNPVELVFGSLKTQFYKSQLTPQGQARLSIPLRVEDLVTSLCTPALVQGCFRHVDGIVQRAIIDDTGSARGTTNEG